VLGADRAAYEVSKLQLVTLNLVMTNIRTVMSSMTPDELLSVAASTGGGISKSTMRVWLVERPDLPSGVRIGVNRRRQNAAPRCPALT